ncbi:nuclear transport factor 2 family protein [Actinoallomurus sp. NPDC050550]|uniref:nuclear transport factor 2 family protein n=1 Tax=Actinoallomurus sp. NPDC050550 TaxID=3154937 RepID=UPI0033EFBE5C
MEHNKAQRFAATWAEEWNSHDLDRILSHYADDIVFHSPVAARILPDSDGVIRGKEALRAYWREGLRLIPDLHFEVVGVYTGVDTIVINYRNQDDHLVNEILTFSNGLIVAGHGTYQPRPS